VMGENLRTAGMWLKKIWWTLFEKIFFLLIVHEKCGDCVP
jgi:hypothetical protein